MEGKPRYPRRGGMVVVDVVVDVVVVDVVVVVVVVDVVVVVVVVVDDDIEDVKTS